MPFHGLKPLLFQKTLHIESTPTGERYIKYSKHDCSCSHSHSSTNCDCHTHSVKWKYIDHGSQGLIYQLVISMQDGDTRTYCMKLIPLRSGVNNESQILEKLRRVKERCPHLISYYGSLHGSGIPILSSKVLTYVRAMVHGECNTSEIIFSEWVRGNTADKFMNLYTRLISSKQWMQILFQVFYTLHALQTIYPGFRHNDLGLRNIMIEHLKHGKVLTYKIGNIVYQLTNVRHMVKVIDFGMSTIVEEPSQIDSYYDIHTILADIHALARTSRIQLPEAVMNLIKQIISVSATKIKIKINREKDRVRACSTPLDVLNNEFFNQFIIPNQNHATISDSQFTVDNFNVNGYLRPAAAGLTVTINRNPITRRLPSTAASADATYGSQSPVGHAVRNSFSERAVQRRRRLCPFIRKSKWKIRIKKKRR